MEVVRRELLEFVGERGLAVVASVLCFTAGWALAHWSRRFGVGDKSRGVPALPSTSDAAVDDAGAGRRGRRIASRTPLTAGERRLAREAAGELLTALSRYRDARERDGPGVGDPGRLAGEGAQDGDVRLRERAASVHDQPDGDHARQRHEDPDLRPLVRTPDHLGG
nr:protein m38.5 [Murid betaherpesvirus 2]